MAKNNDPWAPVIETIVKITPAVIAVVAALVDGYNKQNPPLPEPKSPQK